MSKGVFKLRDITNENTVLCGENIEIKTTPFSAANTAQ